MHALKLKQTVLEPRHEVVTSKSTNSREEQKIQKWLLKGIMKGVSVDKMSVHGADNESLCSVRAPKHVYQGFGIDLLKAVGVQTALTSGI